jgi:GH15 family glucan-1,4-alpha-glucosidase
VYSYGLVGNCNVSALISHRGSIDWMCFPRPDSEPAFGKVLDPDGGHFSICLADEESVKSRQHYLQNTNILITELYDAQGNRIRITDFCPRFEQHGRMFRPLSLFRIVEPISGVPAIRVSCRPIEGWSKEPARTVRGSSHLRFDIRDDSLRLVTNMPLTHLSDENPFHLTQKIYFGLSWSQAIEEDLPQLTERFLQQTTAYWHTWVKHCSVPSLFQKETIRSALALKLHCYEDTGAILAALTTSLPETLGEERNWDYRYCWLRDSYFVLSAFHNLGHFEEMEGFLKFFLNIAHQHEASRERLAPVYTLSHGLTLPEKEHLHWKGYRDSAPVRTLNQAGEHVQNDVYGEMVLTLSPIFFDERFFHLRNRDHEGLLENLANLCAKTISQPDAGLWEVRQGWQEHSFANLMCWAGLERVTRIQKKGYLTQLGFDAAAAQERARLAILRAVKEGSIRNGPSDSSFDSSLSLASVLRFPENDLCLRTVDEIRRNLALGTDAPSRSFFYRYVRSDDFGRPSSAFVICSYWIAQALARLGRHQDSLQILTDLKTAENEVGLLSEHFLPGGTQQLGNFPQAYSHVGQINAAFAASPAWSEVL